MKFFNNQIFAEYLKKYSVIFLFFLFNNLFSIVVESPLTFDVELQKSQSGSIKINIRNTKDYAQSAKLYFEDYIMVNDTTFNFAVSDSSNSFSNAKYCKLNNEVMTLNPHQLKEININILPHDKEGSFWSMFIIENLSKRITNINKDSQMQEAVRYGILIKTHINHPEINFDEISITKTNTNNNNLFITFKNKSKWYYKPNLAIDLFDENGNSIQKITNSVSLFPSLQREYKYNINNPNSLSKVQIILSDKDQEAIFEKEI